MQWLLHEANAQQHARPESGRTVEATNSPDQTCQNNETVRSGAAENTQATPSFIRRRVHFLVSL